MYTITLNDGRKISNLERSGTYFATSENISPEIFDGNLKHITITSTDKDDAQDICGEFENMRMTHLFKLDGKTLFLIIPYTREELRELEIDAKLEYLSLMSGIEF